MVRATGGGGAAFIMYETD